MQNRNSLKEGYLSCKTLFSKLFFNFFNVCLYFKKLFDKKWFPLKEKIEVITKIFFFSQFWITLSGFLIKN
jgi:hypothetical protein